MLDEGGGDLGRRGKLILDLEPVEPAMVGTADQGADFIGIKHM